jgi:hypothetical protein
MDKGKLIGLTLFVLIILVISGCSGSGKTEGERLIEQIRSGNQGLSMIFLADSPPYELKTVSTEDKKFIVALEVRNLGAFPQPEDGSFGPPGRIYLSGYDSSIISIYPKDNADLQKKELEGKNRINPVGGTDYIEFDGTVFAGRLDIENYDFTLLATACYGYETVAGPTVCMDPDPYSTIREKKVCEVHDLSLSDQGAPVAITSIQEEASDDRTEFRITIKNVGGGDVLTTKANSQGNILEKCNPLSSQKVEREDINKVYLSSIKIGDQPLTCRAFIGGNFEGNNGLVRLVNGEGAITCYILKSQYANYDTSSTPFTTPLIIKLDYVYRSTAQKSIKITNELRRESRGSKQPGIQV